MGKLWELVKDILGLEGTDSGSPSSKRPPGSGGDGDRKQTGSRRCPHCGQQHGYDVKSCPTTGKKIDEPRERYTGGSDISREAFSVPNWARGTLIAIALGGFVYLGGIEAVGGLLAAGGRLVAGAGGATQGARTAVAVGVGLGAAGSGEAAPVPVPSPTGEPEASDVSQLDDGIASQAPIDEQESTEEGERGQLGVCPDLTGSEWSTAASSGQTVWKFTAGQPGLTATFSQPGASQSSEQSLYAWTGPYDGTHLELKAPRITYNNGAEITVADELSLDLNPTECDCMTGTYKEVELTATKVERIAFARVGRQVVECNKE